MSLHSADGVRLAAIEKRVASYRALGESLAEVGSVIRAVAEPVQFLARNRSDIDVRAPDSLSLEPARQLNASLFNDKENSMQAIIGASFGTVIGFGLGHAIQGRYAESGWKWTLAESALLGAVVATTSAYCSNDPDVTRARSGTTCSSGIPALAILGLVGVHVWQSVDLWTEASRISAGLPHRSLTIAPRTDVPGVVAVVGW